jgi:hypothetical protein
VRRPRNRWENVIQRDAAYMLRTGNWKAAARDKEEWRKKVGEVMARKKGRSAIEEEEYCTFLSSLKCMLNYRKLCPKRNVDEEKTCS